MNAATIVEEIQQSFSHAVIAIEQPRDGIPTLWINREQTCDFLGYLKTDIDRPYRVLYDLTAIDERMRVHRDGQPASDFSVVYHLLSFDRNEYIRVKVPLPEDDLRIPTITRIWPSANWYEREIWDMFGIVVEDHPHLTRILMPRTWVGHPLRKEHPARATEMGPFQSSE